LSFLIRVLPIGSAVAVCPRHELPTFSPVEAGNQRETLVTECDLPTHQKVRIPITHFFHVFDTIILDPLSVGLAENGPSVIGAIGIRHLHVPPAVQVADVLAYPRKCTSAVVRPKLMIF